MMNREKLWLRLRISGVSRFDGVRYRPKGGHHLTRLSESNSRRAEERA